MNLTSKDILKGATEPAFSGLYAHHSADGVYTCAGCGQALFSSDEKFDSGSGWPSFFASIPQSITLHADTSHGMQRTEVRCQTCNGHLGHYFEDGPKKSRFCINSLALEFGQVALFGAGCFWGVQDKFSRHKGVTKTYVGYSGGTKTNPTYEQVCTGKTGHIEVCQVHYTCKYEELLELFWKIHDYTQKDGQGPDIGEQYTSHIFCYTQSQQTKAHTSKPKSALTKILPASQFYRAEEYHQNYLQKRNKI